MNLKITEACRAFESCTMERKKNDSVVQWHFDYSIMFRSVAKKKLNNFLYFHFETYQQVSIAVGRLVVADDNMSLSAGIVLNEHVIL